MAVTVLVLAAGFSRRLGSPKQLAKFDGETLIHRAVRIAMPVGPVIAVVPPDDGAVRAAIADLGVAVVINTQREEGMASSIRAGLEHALGDVIITLCDQPRITTEHLLALRDAGSPIAASGYSGVAGVPAFFAAAFRDELLALRGDAGARGVIARHRDLVTVVPFAPAAEDVDI